MAHAQATISLVHPANAIRKLVRLSEILSNATDSLAGGDQVAARICLRRCRIRLDEVLTLLEAETGESRGHRYAAREC